MWKISGEFEKSNGFHANRALAPSRVTELPDAALAADTVRAYTVSETSAAACRGADTAEVASA